MSCGKPCNEPGSLPWAIHGAAGIAKAALGINRAPEATVEARRDICRECPHSKKHPTLKTTNGLPIIDLKLCSKCLCNIRAKTSNADEQCCDGRWTAVEKETT